MKDSDSEVRLATVATLGDFARNPEVLVPALIELFKDPGDDEGMRWASLYAPENYGRQAKRAVPELLKALNHPNPDLRMATALALKEIDPDTAAKAASGVLP